MNYVGNIKTRKDGTEYKESDMILDLMKIIDHFGPKHQGRKLIEEAQEVDEAVIEYEDFKHYIDINSVEDVNKSAKLRNHIIEEIGDLYNILEQIVLYYEIDEDLIKITRVGKIKRTLYRIDSSR